jgi:hypothetical protein
MILFLSVLLLAARVHATPTPAPTVNPALERCIEADALLDVKLSTANNVAGDAFRFTTAGRIPKIGLQPEIPAGTRGYGIISFSHHAGAGGQSGMLILEPRYVVLRDGRRVQVMADPAGPDLVRNGKSKNAPGILQQMPLIGLAAGGYNALHRGKEVVIDKGTLLRIIVGDGLADASCYVVLPQRQ